VLQLTGEENFEQELREILETVDFGHAEEFLFSWKYQLPIFLAVSIGMFNQLSGINAVGYYLKDIFARAGFSKVSSDLQAVTVGVTNLAIGILAMSIIDKISPENAAPDRVTGVYRVPRGSFRSVLHWNPREPPALDLGY
jgi:MFS transporter, SP family, arabinose:H+ symporter